MEREQERLARTCKTDKYACSKANSGEFPVNSCKFDYSPTVSVSSFIHDIPAEQCSKNVFTTSYQVSQVLPSQQSATNVSPQQITHPETNVFVELVESLEGVITKMENVVKNSPSYQNKCSSCHADPGSLDFPVLSSESEINFCERLKEKVPQVLKRDFTEENELAFGKSKQIVDTSDKSDNAVELTKCCESSTSVNSSEANGKQEENDTFFISPVLKMRQLWSSA